MEVMRHLPVYLLALAASGLSAQTLQPDERSFAMSHLHATRKQFLDSIAGLSPAQLAFKAGPERWSIAECAEHITLSEDLIYNVATDRVMKTPIVKRDPAVYKKIDQELVKNIIDRSHKVTAPEQLKPSNKWKSMEEMITEFKEKRNRTLDWVEKTDVEARSHVAPHPVFKDLDAYEWILLLSGHSERHTLQILEVKADPKFPKK